jgi:HlyD family secretion protein
MNARNTVVRMPMNVMNRINALSCALLLFAWIAAASCTTFKELLPLGNRDETIPTAFVVREPVDVRIHTLGELYPVRMETIIAPPVAGGTLQIVRIVQTGDYVKEGDIVVQFDPSEQEYNLEQSKSQVEEAEQKIKKMKLDQEVRVAQEKVTLLGAESAVRRAELKIKGNALLSRIAARKNEMALEEAERRLEQLRRDLQSNADSDKANLAVQTITRDKAMFAMRLAQENIGKMTIRAPMNGIVSAGSNIQALISGGSIVIISNNIPEYKAGDQASPGQPIAQIQDVDTVEVHSKVLETDRGNLARGQQVEIWLDSRPTQPYEGTIKSLASSANSVTSGSTLEMLESLSTRSFDAVFDLDPEGERLNLGTTAQIVIKGKNMDNALSLPRQAIFQKDGRPVVYVKDADNWKTRNIQIKYLTESRAVLEGIEEGTEVALVDPERSTREASSENKPLLSMRTGAHP